MNFCVERENTFLRHIILYKNNNSIFTYNNGMHDNIPTQETPTHSYIHLIQLFRILCFFFHTFLYSSSDAAGRL